MKIFATMREYYSIQYGQLFISWELL